MKKKQFSVATKKKVVAELKAGTSISSLMKKYKVKSHNTIVNWEKAYGYGKSPKVSNLDNNKVKEENANMRGAIIHIIVQDLKETLESMSMESLIDTLKKQAVR